MRNESLFINQGVVKSEDPVRVKSQLCIELHRLSISEKDEELLVVLEIPVLVSSTLHDLVALENEWSRVKADFPSFVS